MCSHEENTYYYNKSRPIPNSIIAIVLYACLKNIYAKDLELDLRFLVIYLVI